MALRALVPGGIVINGYCVVSLSKACVLWQKRAAVRVVKNMLHVVVCKIEKFATI